jgi:multiple sugar transport system ATP-binding protein
MSGIVLEGVRKEFPGGVVAVKDLSLEVDQGEFVVLVGPSGCGKTTTLRMVAGLEEVSSGDVFIGGKRVTDEPPRSRDIAMVFQNYALYAHMKVKDNIGFGLKMSGNSKAEIRPRVLEAAEILGITDLLDRKPGQLSGGQRQRVAMGRAIVREPAAFLMDEPLSNLDAKLRVEMRAEIIGIQRRVNTPTLYVTHDQIEAITMGDRVAILRDGALEQLGSPDELYARPANTFVAGFIGSPAMNLLAARLEPGADGPVVSFCGCRVPLTRPTLDRHPHVRGGKPREVVLGIRPEDTSVRSAPGDGHDAAFGVDVVRTESVGAELIAYVRPTQDFVPLGEAVVTVNPELGGPDDGGRNGGERGEAANSSGARQGARDGLLVARLDRLAKLEEGGSSRIGVDPDRLYLFDSASGEAL